MKKIGNILFFVICNMFLGLQIAFADVTVKAEMYPDQVGVGDQARIILTINSNQDFDMQEPDFPKADGFQVLQAENAGRSSSSRMNIVNGKTDFSKTITQHYEYVVQFNKKGLVIIPSITVNISGSISATAPIKVQVAATSQQDVQRPSRQRQQQLQDDDNAGVDDDMFSQLMKQRQKILEEVQNQMNGRGGPGPGGNPFQQEPQAIPNLKLDANTNESFFVYADADKTTAYEGEQVTVNWYIYVKGSIEAIDRAKFPDLKGFWKEIIEEVPALQFSNAIVNGIPYKRALLASHALFPIKAGVAVIDEFKIKATIRNQTQFGWGQPHEYTKASKRISINVLPLPSEGKPLSFSGAVGQFQIQTHVDGLQVKAGQPFSLKVKFEGQGNAKLIELPPIAWPDSLSVFDTKSESKFFKNGQSYKEFEILLVQSKEGLFKIPLITFSYFDPEQKKYVIKNTEELPLTAIKSDQPLSTSLIHSTSSDSTGVLKQKDLSPVLEWPGAFSWMAYRNLFFSVCGLVGILFLGIKFYSEYTKLNMKPSLQEKVNQKIKKIDLEVKNQSIKNIGMESVNLIYLLLEGLSSEIGAEKSISLDISQRLAGLPMHYKEKYEQSLSEKFNYFQMIGFAPDEVRDNLMKQKNIESELIDLKKIAKEMAIDHGSST